MTGDLGCLSFVFSFKGAFDFIEFVDCFGSP